MSKAEDRYLEHFQDGRLRNCSSKEAFLLGYHQAEKDLDISWVKEVSGVKEMKRAEERALEAYPKDIEEYVDVNGLKSVVDNNSWQRAIFLKGYRQASEDLALTWEDIKLIWNITDEMDNMPEEEFYQEVLNRFNKLKEK